MDTARFAKPGCKLCHGKGRVKTGERLGDQAICLCAIAGKRQHDAELIIELRFPAIARKMTLDSFQTGGRSQNESALTIALNFIDNYEQAASEGWVLGFGGKPAAGKTHLAVAIAQECVRRYLAKPMLFNVPSELRAERERFRRNRGWGSDETTVGPIDRAINAELLILDDIAAERHLNQNDSDQASWAMEQLYTILNARGEALKPTLFTSNLLWSDLERRFSGVAGERVLSRIERSLVAPLVEVVEVPGANRQDEKALGTLMQARDDVKEDTFAVRDTQAELSDRYSSKKELAAAIAVYREQHGDEACAANIRIRALRGGRVAGREIPVSDILLYLDKQQSRAA